MVPKGKRFWMFLQLQYNTLQTFCTIHFAERCTNLWHIAIRYKAVAFLAFLGFKAFLAIALVMVLILVLTILGQRCEDLLGYGFHTAASLSPTLDSHWWRRCWNFWLERECPLGLFEGPHCWWRFKAALVSGPPAANIFHCCSSARRSQVLRFAMQPSSLIILAPLQIFFRQKDVILDVSSCEVFFTFLLISLSVARSCHQSLRRLPHAKFEVSKWRC